MSDIETYDRISANRELLERADLLVAKIQEDSITRAQERQELARIAAIPDKVVVVDRVLSKEAAAIPGVSNFLQKRTEVRDNVMAVRAVDDPFSHVPKTLDEIHSEEPKPLFCT